MLIMNQSKKKLIHSLEATTVDTRVSVTLSRKLAVGGMSSSMGAGPFVVEDERAALCAKDRARVVCLGELLSHKS